MLALSSFTRSELVIASGMEGSRTTASSFFHRHMQQSRQGEWACYR